MISHGEGFVLRHRSGRYLNTWAHFVTIKTSDGRDSRMHDPAHPMAMIFESVDSPFAAALVHDRDKFEEWLRRQHWSLVWDQWEIVPGPGCIVCGERWHNPMRTDRHGEHRCKKHHDRNPCAIEGCKRTTAADGNTASDQYLCSEHWRMHCPPHSSLRRTYRRFFRIAKKIDWTPELRLRFWRFWNALIKRARADRQPPLDVDEINRIMGWDAP